MGYNNIIRILYLFILNGISLTQMNTLVKGASAITDEWGQHRGECLPGFEDMMPTSNYCFAVNLSGLETWDDAENICRIMSQYHGGHLVTIYSTTMNSAISRYIRNHSPDNITTEIWIGLQNVDLDKGNPSIWKWADGSQLNYTNWVPGFPVTIRNDCVQLEWSRFKSTKWYNTPCKAKRHFICQAPKVLQHASIIPECGKLGVPPITPTTFEDYVIPFWFRESVFRQDANLGFLSNQKKSTQNTVVCVWDYFLCIKKYGVWSSNKKCCSKRLRVCRKHMKLTKARLDLGPDYTSSPLTVGDRWLTWPDQGTPPTLDPSTLQIASITTESSLESPAILKIPTLKESCYTTGGGTTGAACVFPFIFRDKLRNSCTWDDAESEKPWCSIRVDEEGYHIGNKGLWGYCSSYCPVETSNLEAYGSNTSTSQKHSENKITMLNSIKNTTSISGYDDANPVKLTSKWNGGHRHNLNLNSISSILNETVEFQTSIIPNTSMNTSSYVKNELSTVSNSMTFPSTSTHKPVKTRNSVATRPMFSKFGKIVESTSLGLQTTSNVPERVYEHSTGSQKENEISKMSFVTKIKKKAPNVQNTNKIQHLFNTKKLGKIEATKPISKSSTHHSINTVTKSSKDMQSTTTADKTTLPTSTTKTPLPTTTVITTSTTTPTAFELLRRNILSFFPNIFDINLNFLSWG